MLKLVRDQQRSLLGESRIKITEMIGLFMIYKQHLQTQSVKKCLLERGWKRFLY